MDFPLVVNSFRKMYPLLFSTASDILEIAPFRDAAVTSTSRTNSRSTRQLVTYSHSSFL